MIAIIISRKNFISIFFVVCRWFWIFFKSKVKSCKFPENQRFRPSPAPRTRERCPIFLEVDAATFWWYLWYIYEEKILVSWKLTSLGGKTHIAENHQTAQIHSILSLIISEIMISPQKWSKYITPRKNKKITYSWHQCVIIGEILTCFDKSVMQKHIFLVLVRAKITILFYITNGNTVVGYCVCASLQDIAWYALHTNLIFIISTWKYSL